MPETREWIHWGATALPFSAPTLPLRPGERSLPDVELQLLLAGLKPAFKAEDLPLVAALALTDQVEGAGYAAIRSLNDASPRPESRGLAGAAAWEPLHTDFVGAREVVQELAALDEVQKKGGPARAAAIRRSGELLGYPACCARFFASLAVQDDSAVLGGYEPPGGEAVHPWLDFFPPVVSPVTWYPCSLDCGASLERAIRWADGLEAAYPGSADSRLGALAGLLVVFDRFAFVQLREVDELDGWLRFAAVYDALSHTQDPRLAGSETIRRFRRNVTAVFRACTRARFDGMEVELRDERGQAMRGIMDRPPLLIRYQR